jgi:hypothetical protein
MACGMHMLGNKQRLVFMAMYRSAVIRGHSFSTSGCRGAAGWVVVGPDWEKWRKPHLGQDVAGLAAGQG